MPTVSAVAAVPAANPAPSDKAAQTPSPQPQAAVPPESDPVLNALQNLADAEAALAKSVTAALPAAAATQGGLAPLLADLVQAQQTPGLPAPVQAAILEILALRSPLDAEITGPDIKAALTNSGLFSEAKAAAELQTPNAGVQAPPAGTDIKTALLVLRQVLTTWLSDTTQAPTPGKDAPPAPSRTPSDNPPSQTYRGSATGNAPPPMAPAPTAPASTALSPATNPDGPAKPAPSGSLPPQAQILSTSEAMAAAPQKLTPAEGTPVMPRPAATSPGQAPPPPTTDSKTAPPVPQQTVKAPPVNVPAGPDAPGAATGAAPEPLRATLNNSPPPISRGPASPQPPLAPPSPVPGSPVPAASVPVSSTPVFSAMYPQSTPNAAQAGTSQPQAQIAAAPEAINEAPQQTATPEAAVNIPPSAPVSAGALPAGADLKLALGLFQQLLKASLDNIPAQPYGPETGRNPAPEPKQAAANNPPPPPYRGGPTSAQPVLQSTLPADANPRLVGQVLLSHTEAALAHLKLLQIASLPDSPQGAAHHEDQGPRLMFEIPFSTPNGNAIAQFEIRRDGRGGTEEQSGPVWRARFSLDVEPMGPVHAQIVLMGGRAWVTLWAEREASIQILREKEALLSQALKDSDVVPEVAFCLGAPHRRVAPAGQFLDRAS